MRTRLPLLVLGISALVALVIGLVIGGSPTAPLLADAGPFVRWASPIASGLSYLAAAATLGPLVFACFAVPRESKDFERVVTLAATGAVVWTILSVAAAVLAFAQAISSELRADTAFTNALWTYLTDTGAGQARVWGIAFVAVVAVILAVVRSYWGIAVAAILAACALVPIADLAHAGGSDHNVAWAAMFLHVLFASVWVGGLLALAVCGRSRVLAERFSTIALLSFVFVGAAGVVSAVLRLDELSDLTTPYGTLLLIKTVALIALGVVGAVHRRHAIQRLPSGVAFVRLLLAELVVMGVAMGMASALGDTAPPRGPGLIGTTPSEILAKTVLPPDPTAWRYLFGPPDPDVMWLAICAVMAGFYLAGVRRLHRRGDRWPVLRTMSWLAGVVGLAWVTSGGINAYHELLFSAHMLGHMVLGMVIPVLLVPGAPITLALRTIAPRHDGSRGPREWLLGLVHSRYFQVLGNPYVAAGIFVGGLWIFYYTPLFRWANMTHLGHQWMILHFLLSGYLFVQALIGTDPSPKRPPWAIRLVILLVTMAGHAFFGLAIMTSTTLLLADWYGAMGWDIGVTALEDQQRAGGIAWSVGELPTLALAILVAVQWVRSDEREQRRVDRKADRDHDADLAAYNAMLAERAEQDRRTASPFD